MSKKMKEELRNYYRASTPRIDDKVKQDALAFLAETVMQTDDSKVYAEEPVSEMLPEAQIGFWRFTLEQIRFIRVRTWIMQLALMAVLVMVPFFGISETSIPPMVACLTMLSILICIPEVLKSFDTGVAELEFANRFNCAQVLASRMALFGLADIMWLSYATIAVPALSGCDALQMILFACIPFFLSCGGCFWIVRIRPQNMVSSCTLLVVLLIAAACLAWAVNPHWYEFISSTVWVGLLVISIGFAVYEVMRTMRDVAAGLDRIIPSNA